MAEPSQTLLLSKNRVAQGEIVQSKGWERICRTDGSKVWTQMSSVKKPEPVPGSPPKPQESLGPAATHPTDDTGLPPPKSVHEYGVIGNMHTAALVSQYGSIDWLCMPRFASPSVFARLLDTERGGFHAIFPSEQHESVQAYRASTNVLDTSFRCSGGRLLHLTDFMPVFETSAAEDCGMVVRRIEARGGPVPVRVQFRPAFYYAQSAAAFETSPAGVLATGEHSLLLYRVTGEGTTAAVRGMPTEVEAVPGEPLFFELIWGGERPTAETPDQLLDRTVRYWRRWVSDCQAGRRKVPATAFQRVERSTLLLKLLSHRDTGAFVAAPTTSLPEWPGGSRNWDYRYSWVRDTAMIAKTLTFLGHEGEARAFLRWSLRQSRMDKDGRLCVLYGVHGETDLEERELRHLSGFLRSQPVRVGNGAEYQFQLDIYGSLLNLAYQMADVEGAFLASEWAYIARLANDVVDLWRKPDRGIWEVRGPPVHYVHSQLMAWVALDRAAKLASRFGTSEERDRWNAEAQKVSSTLLEKGFDPGMNSFVQSFEHHVPDASVLRIPIEGLLPFTDPRVQGTIASVQQHLTHGPFVYRYRRPDGIEGPEGAFLLCSFWLVECLAGSGRREEAYSLWNALMAASSPLGLFSEEFDPATETPLGNYPQAFTHIGVIRAALALEGPTLKGYVSLPSLEKKSGNL